MKWLQIQLKVILLLHLVWCVNLDAQHTEEQPFADQFVEDLSNPVDEKPIIRRKIRDGVFHLEQGNYHGKEVNGEIVIPIEYQYLQWDYNAYLNATKNGKCGIISSKNETIVPFLYSSAHFNIKHNTVNVCTPNPNKGCGVINLDSQPIVPLIYTDHCRSISFTKHPSIAYACSDDKPMRTVFYDSTGVIISEHPYKFIESEITEDYFAVMGKEYRQGIINSNFEIVVPTTHMRYNWYFKNHACMSYTKDEKIYHTIIDLADGSIKLDLRGIFNKPNERGIFIREYYENKEFNRESLDIHDFIISND